MAGPIRHLGQIAGQKVPPELFADTSTPRGFTWDVAPNTIAGVTLAVGDKWFVIPSQTGGSGYVPRQVPPYGTYQPDNTNTGIVSNRTALTPVNFPGNVPFIPTAGATYTSKEIFGDIWSCQMKTDGSGAKDTTTTINNVTFQDCIIRGPSTWQTNDAGIVDLATPGTARGWTFVDCTIIPQLPQYLRVGIIGCGFRAERCRVAWCNDSFGVYQTKFTGGLLGDAVILGCYTSDTVYWHGSVSQYGWGGGVAPDGLSYPAQLPVQSTASITVPLPGSALDYTGGTIMVANYGFIKADGTHNDAIHVQGISGPTKTGWFIGNTLHNNDAEQLVAIGGSDASKHPLGWSDKWPMLGTQDCHKRYRTLSNQGSADPNPALTPWKFAVVDNRLPNGRFSGSGVDVIVTQVTTVYTQPDTLVIEQNWLDEGNYAGNFHATDGLGSGNTTVTCQFTFQNNHIGSNIYNASLTAPTGRAWYIVRIDSQARNLITGLFTNTFSDSGIKPVGTAISAGSASSGNGIVYDA